MLDGLDCFNHVPGDSGLLPFWYTRLAAYPPGIMAVVWAVPVVAARPPKCRQAPIPAVISLLPLSVLAESNGGDSPIGFQTEQGLARCLRV